MVFPFFQSCFLHFYVMGIRLMALGSETDVMDNEQPIIFIVLQLVEGANI